MLLHTYLDPFEALNCVRASKVFHRHANQTILRQRIAKHMNQVLSVYEQKPITYTRYWPDNDAVCMCGTIVKRKNLKRHQYKKCLNSGTLQDRCPHCDVQILEMTPTHITLLHGTNHFPGRCCGNTNSKSWFCENMRMRYWKIVQRNRPILQRIQNNVNQNQIQIGWYVASAVWLFVVFVVSWKV